MRCDVANVLNVTWRQSEIALFVLLRSGDCIMSLRHSALYIVALMVAPACGAHAASYNFTEINPSGAIASSAQGINDTGTIVGGYNDATGAGFGFIDIAGSFTQLAPTPAASCGAFASICN